MKENRTMETIHRGLVKKYHTLCSKLSLTSYEKESILASYGVDSSLDLDNHELIDICGNLSKELNGKEGAELDKLRKRCIAAIGGWLRAEHKKQNIGIIKGIACRASKTSNFNRIPAGRLRNLIGEFNRKVKDKEEVNKVVMSMNVSKLKN